MEGVLAPFMARWRLEADGDEIVTHSSRLVPVRRRDGSAAMLKLAGIAEEARGGRVMEWWGGEGAARVLARRGAAVLLERGGESLAGMPDEVATPVICAVAAGLHRARAGKAPALVPLRRWFRALLAAREGVLAEAAGVARGLLDDPREVVVLHGDLHHMNVLDFGTRGWLAIDPKGLVGERGFEFATLFRNPDAGRALAPGRLEREAARVAALAGVEQRRLLEWVMAVAGLSAAWFLGDGMDASADLRLAEMAGARLRA